jgi:hypothetical protein
MDIRTIALPHASSRAASLAALGISPQTMSDAQRLVERLRREGNASFALGDLVDAARRYSVR